MKIVAISGGNNSNIKKNGLPEIYEHEAIDKEIISISSKSNPNVLFVSHASDEEFEIASFNKIVSTYGKMYYCPVKHLSINALNDKKLTESLIKWSDVIYIGGGNTKKMMNLWKKHNFDELLINASKEEKVLCGISAGANCWFTYSCSDYLQMELNDLNAPFMPLEGLKMIDLIFNPHANYQGRLEGMKDILKSKQKNGLALSNNVAIEIINENYKLIEGISSDGEEKFAILAYFKDGNYITEQVREKGTIKELILKR